ncbi:MAG TPA: hypothetical protein PKD05_03690 [Candidatus Melainabacteria bacterium]|nr:hypothetical protein [Candidatus Melainabacteria bacterium]HMP50632.1 hypothetical protein [Candidatus Melainabacteria bacterium]
MSNHPLSPAGYDQEEAWAHQQNEEAKRKLREKAEKEKAEKEKGEAASGSDSNTASGS